MKTHTNVSVIYFQFKTVPHSTQDVEPGWRSRYSDWLRVRRPKGRSLGRDKRFFSSPRRRLEQLWGPPRRLSDKYLALSPGT
jgi:hypothetical protein